MLKDAHLASQIGLLPLMAARSAPSLCLPLSLQFSAN